MLKVGRKRKEGEKAHKLYCLDLTEISPRSQGNEIQDRFDLLILCHDQTRYPPS